ncbi:MAG: thioredoxin family protein [Bacteroidota bacterium]
MSAKNIEQLLQNSQAPIVMTFLADWKANSQILDSFYQDLAPRFPEVEFIKVDADNAESLVRKFGILEVPTSLFIKKRDILDYFEGILPKEEIEQRIRKLCDGESDLCFVLLD